MDSTGTRTGTSPGAVSGARSAMDRLRDAGLRVTGPRLAVLDALDGARDRADHHLAAADVAEQVRARLGSVSTQAVYDCLDVLVRTGLARRIEPAGRPSLFEARVGDNHHHLVCRSCGTTVDVDCAEGVAPCLLPAAHGPDGTAGVAGFVIEEAEVTFWGRCATCAAPRTA